MGKFDGILREAQALKRALDADQGGLTGRVFMLRGADQADLLRQIEEQLAPFGLTPREAVDSGISKRLRVVELPWLTSRDIAGDRSHE